jgi:hypothetical protein
MEDAINDPQGSVLDPEGIDDRTAPHKKKVISRLVLQKLLSSDSSAFLARDSRAEINSVFLSESPDRSMNVTYRLPDVRDSYYSTVTSIHISWEDGKEELQDLDGNVWSTSELKIRPSISSSYSSSSKEYSLRAACIAAVNEMISELSEMIPGPVRVMTLNTSQRIDRDKQRRLDYIKSFLVRLVTSEDGKKYRGFLRKGGASRSIDRSHLGDIEPGTYEFEVNDGSRRCPIIKKYSVTVTDPAATFRRPSIRRIP